MSSSDHRNEADPSGITPLASGSGWHLQTPRSSLVVAIHDGVPSQRYWGARIDPNDVAVFEKPDRGRWNSSFQRAAELEEHLPVDGGSHWSIPTLQVRFVGGVRSLELRFESASVAERDDATELVLRLRDASFEFAVELHYRVRAGTDVIERWVSADNQSATGSVQILRMDSGNWPLPDRDDYRSSTVHGYWGGEMQLERGRLPTGEYTLTSRQGTTGAGSNPWIMIDDTTATEHSGETFSVVLAWSGSWRLTAQRRPEGNVSVSAGFGHDGLEWNLEPGGSLLSPSAFGLVADGGYGGASREWHRFARAQVLPRASEERPVLFNSWEATGFDLTEQGQIELAERAAHLGIELFVVDDGWFGARTHDAAGLGDWTPNPDRFPQGLHRLVGEVRSRGMAFGLWVEPEMVNPDSDLYREHPDWIMHWPGRTREVRRNQLVLNFAREDVRSWAFAWLDELVRSYSIDFLKWDMNRPFTQAGWPDNPTNQDMLWIEHVRGVYGIIDRLRAAHPELRIEACSSGGGRVDLGMLARTDQAWTSDNTDALDRQVIQHGFTQIYPAIAMGAWVTETVNGMTGRTVPLDYRFHVAMAGNLGIGGDLAAWDDDELARAAEHIRSYKAIRPTIQRGELFRLGGSPGREWSALEYVDETRVVVLAYDPHRSLASTPRRLQLRGLAEHGVYRDTATGERYSGGLLMGRGILFTDTAALRGTDNTRFSSADYASSLTVLEREDASAAIV